MKMKTITKESLGLHLKSKFRWRDILGYAGNDLNLL